MGAIPPEGVIKGFCEVVPAPPGLGYQFLVRFSGRAFRILQVTMRVKGVERVLCRTDGAADAIAETRLGPKGAGPVVPARGHRELTAGAVPQFAPARA